MVEYTPPHTGLYEVKVEVNGQPLDGNPWSVQVIPHQYQLKFSFGSNGSGPGQFDGPYDIAVNKKTGTVAISDYRNERIQLFGTNGRYLREIGLRTGCSSLGFTKSGQIIAVTPGDVHKMSLLSKQGQFVKHIDSEHLKFPFHISTDGVDDITVCDRESNEVIIISHDGTGLVTRIAASEHSRSVMCAIYHKDTDRYFVSDSKADLVKVFDKNGNFLYEIGRGKLLNPFGLAIDKFKNLIVCDTGNKRLKVFTTKGDFLSETEQCFHTPRFIAVSKEGEVLVTDYEKDCVFLFQ